MRLPKSVSAGWVGSQDRDAGKSNRSSMIGFEEILGLAWGRPFRVDIIIDDDGGRKSGERCRGVKSME